MEKSKHVYDKKEEKYLFECLEKTITKCSTYIASITKELEEKEKRHNEKRIKAGRNPHKSKWQGTTARINLIGGFIFTLFSVEKVMKYNVTLFLPLKKFIQARNEDFFLKADIYPGVTPDEIHFFTNIWTVPGALEEKEKETIWRFWDNQIAIVEDWLELTKWKPSEEDELMNWGIDYEAEAKKVGIKL